MTNAEINLSQAVEALKAGKLTGSAKSFIESIQHYSKKQLNGLTSKQYSFLRDISNKTR